MKRNSSMRYVHIELEFVVGAGGRSTFVVSFGARLAAPKVSTSVVRLTDPRETSEWLRNQGLVPGPNHPSS